VPTIYHVAVEGDPLDSGGNSQAIESDVSHSIGKGPDGRSRGQTYLGHRAWCAARQSVGEIVAGAGISDSLSGWDDIVQAQEAIGGDIVLCKCERHPRIASVYARSCEYVDAGNASTARTRVPSTPSQRFIYDQQFPLVDANGPPLEDAHYMIESQ